MTPSPTHPHFTIFLEVGYDHVAFQRRKKREMTAFHFPPLPGQRLCGDRAHLTGDLISSHNGVLNTRRVCKLVSEIIFISSCKYYTRHPYGHSSMGGLPFPWILFSGTGADRATCCTSCGICFKCSWGQMYRRRLKCLLIGAVQYRLVRSQALSINYKYTSNVSHQHQLVLFDL